MSGLRRVSSLECWVVDLFKEIEQAAEKNEDFNMYLDKELVQDLAAQSRSLEWIEIY